VSKRKRKKKINLKSQPKQLEKENGRQTKRRPPAGFLATGRTVQKSRAVFSGFRQAKATACS
jgi:hypothetical protein